ncbi:MAG: flagellar basal body P-ring formation chaperone FlgA [Halanaerobiales bacterium]
MVKYPHKKNLFTIGLIIALLLFTTEAVLSQSENTTIQIEDEVTVDREVIRMGDIALIEGSSAEKREELTKIELEKAAPPGYTRKINRELIKLLLEDKGYDPDEFDLQIPRVVRVRTSAKSISEDRLMEFARDKIAEMIESDNGEVIIEKRQIPGDITIPDSEYSLQTDYNREVEPGRISLPVNIMIEGERYKRVYLGLTVKIRQEVLIARRNFSRGDKFDADSFKKAEKEISEINGRLISDRNDNLLQDGEFNRPLAEGEILTSDYLHKPTIIKWGDEIYAEVEVGSVVVKAVVEARQSGKMGEVIKVKNVNSGQEFEARIINSDFVRVIK